MSKKPSETKAEKSNAETVQTEDLNVVVDAEAMDKTLIGHHIEGFNRFTSTGIHQIVTQLFQAEGNIINERNKTAEDNNIATIHFTVTFNDIRIDRPTTMSHASGKKNLLTPDLARQNDRNYSGPLYVSATIVAEAFMRNSLEPKVRTEEIKNYRIASMPVMVGSKHCHTYGMSREEKQKLHEDPRDLGGYFIIKGSEWVVDNIETRLYNSPHCFRNVGHEKEITRLEFISKPGDDFENSSELIIRYLTTGQIYLKFSSNPYLKLLDIPFYMLFRLLGMTTDKEIIDNIIYGYLDENGKPDVVSSHMFRILSQAFKTSDPVFGAAMYMTEQSKLLKYFAQQTAILYEDGVITSKQQASEKNMSYLSANMLKLFDRYLMPHIGLAKDSRHRKLRYLGHLMHKMLLVEMQIEPSTDRDSLKNKRIFSAGKSFAKSFKTQFNMAIVQPIKKKLMKDFKSMPFSQVPLALSVTSAVHGPELERVLIQAIVTGNKELTMMNRQITNRLASEMLHRKNQTNQISTGRVIRTPNSSASKQDARADEMRRVHPSYTGFICPMQSADTGEQVGMVKQMATAASISASSSSELLKGIIREDPLLIPINRCFPIDIHEKKMTKILVNGDWIGCCLNSPLMFYKYRELRRRYLIDEYLDENYDSASEISQKQSKKQFSRKIVQLSEAGIEPMTTIFWNTETNELNFWVDAGRMLRPVLIVRNNSELDPVGQAILGSRYDPFVEARPEEYKKHGFFQDIVLSKSDITQLMRKEITMRDLHARGVIEYISPEEMEKCYIARSLEDLRANQRNPLRRYTHCEIPSGLLGIPALTCPFSHNNAPARITFQTNQVKQTCGWYTLSWPHRVDKHAFLQYYCEVPLVKTLANNYVYPNGLNAIVAITSQGGFNQEDSLDINKSSAERGLYEGLSFNFVKTTLENNESFGNPDGAHTVDIKNHADYSKLSDGMLHRGQKVEKDDVVIGKYYQIPKPTDHRHYKDMSILYNDSEPAIVEKVIRSRNEEDKEFCKVKFSSVRKLSIGAKFSSRAGQKGMTGMEHDQMDMLFTETGITPDLILNPHSIPSRMTINQLVEGAVAKLCAEKGCIADATVFQKIEYHDVGEALEAIGFNYNGTERMFNGRTGEWVDADIFISPCYYQRLQKFVEDSMYSISTGPTCTITRQPLEGKANKGGLRVGEMEKDVIISHGASHFLGEKFRDDSDGFDIYVCRNCGKRPVVNEARGILVCKICRDNADIVKASSTWSSKLFFQELESINVGVRLKVKPHQYEEYM